MQFHSTTFEVPARVKKAHKKVDKSLHSLPVLLIVPGSHRLYVPPHHISQKAGQTNISGITCKQRRVKCDETKPICLRCKTLDKDCFYRLPEKGSLDGKTYQSLNFDDPPPALALAPIDSSSDTARLHQFCLVQSANTFKNIGQPFDTFWTSSVPLFSIHDSSVANLVVAIAARQRFSHHSPTDQEKPKLLQLYDKHYRNALRELTEPDILNKPEVILLCCLMFISMENVKDTLDNGFLHLKSGLFVLREWKSQRLTGATTTTASVIELITDTLEPMFARFEAAVAPTIYRGPLEQQLADLNWDLPTLPARFTDLAHARGSLYEIAQWIFSHGSHQMTLSDPRPDELNLTLEVCTAWRQKLDQYCRDHPGPAARFKLPVLALATNHSIIEMLIKCTILPNELLWGTYSKQLSELLDNIKALHREGLVDIPTRKMKQNLVPRMLPALFAISIISRSRRVQQEALDLMNEIHSSLHDDQCFAPVIGAAVLRIEDKLQKESGSPLMTMDSRVRPLMAELEPGSPGKIVVTYIRPFLNPVVYDDPDFGQIVASAATAKIEMPWNSKDAPPSKLVWLWPVVEFLRLAGSAGLVGPNGNHCLCKTYGGLFSLLK